MTTSEILLQQFLFRLPHSKITNRPILIGILFDRLRPDNSLARLCAAARSLWAE
jgi:hypothetical protein